MDGDIIDLTVDIIWDERLYITLASPQMIMRSRSNVSGYSQSPHNLATLDPTLKRLLPSSLHAMSISHKSMASSTSPRSVKPAFAGMFNESLASQKWRLPGTLRPIVAIQTILQTIKDGVSQTKPKSRTPFVEKSREMDKTVKVDDLGRKLETNFTTNYAVAKIQTAADIDRLIDRLGTGDNGASKKSPCLLGTRRAVLKRITEWIEQSSLHGFCLSGQAGAGKSSIAASIASRERAFKRLGAVFHFTRDDQVRNKAASFDHRVGDRREPRHPADGA
ncbi:hypothetical protein FRB95_009623 [Tulasnella sp. JGI-2019a]|nr:hypothetical protein FRB95_009623 [Tulasnella sp. JGI-2019a]